MDEYSVHSEPDFAPTYEDEGEVTIRKADLRALLDVATGSQDYGSGFLDNEQVETLRRVAPLLGIEPNTVTPRNFVCRYDPSQHELHWMRGPFPSIEWQYRYFWRCAMCGVEIDREPPPLTERPFDDLMWVVKHGDDKTMDRSVIDEIERRRGVNFPWWKESDQWRYETEWFWRVAGRTGYRTDGFLNPVQDNFAITVVAKTDEGAIAEARKMYSDADVDRSQLKALAPAPGRDLDDDLEPWGIGT